MTVGQHSGRRRQLGGDAAQRTEDRGGMRLSTIANSGIIPWPLGRGTAILPRSMSEISRHRHA